MLFATQGGHTNNHEMPLWSMSALYERQMLRHHGLNDPMLRMCDLWPFKAKIILHGEVRTSTFTFQSSIYNQNQTSLNVPQKQHIHKPSWTHNSWEAFSGVHIFWRRSLKCWREKRHGFLPRYIQPHEMKHVLTFLPQRGWRRGLERGKLTHLRALLWSIAAVRTQGLQSPMIIKP